MRYKHMGFCSQFEEFTECVRDSHGGGEALPWAPACLAFPQWTDGQTMATSGITTVSRPSQGLWLQNQGVPTAHTAQPLRLHWAGLTESLFCQKGRNESLRTIWVCRKEERKPFLTGQIYRTVASTWNTVSATSLQALPKASEFSPRLMVGKLPWLW